MESATACNLQGLQRACDSPVGGACDVPCQQCSGLATGLMKQSAIHAQSDEPRVLAEASCFHFSVR